MNSILKTGGTLCALALGISAILRPAHAASEADTPEAAALHEWRAYMKQNPAGAEGCFHASYPNVAWEKVECETAQPRVHPEHTRPSDDEAEVVGNGHDYAAGVTGLISAAGGDFSISGVKSEKSVGVAAFGGGGILGSNEYSVQLNTNAGSTTSACHSHSGCTVWQQFVYATDYISSGVAAVFMQYWLLDWGSSACPSGWGKYGSDCYKNSALAKAVDIPIKDLAQLELTATVDAGGSDTILVDYASDSWSVTAKDSVLDISAVWNKAEFNVVGDAGGSRADFNSGSTVDVDLTVFDISGTAPKCLSNSGTTGETNNLNLGACKILIGGWGIPYMHFSESK